MSKLLTNQSSEGQNKLTTSSGINTALVLNEQPDTAEAVHRISMLLERVVMLWQIPNWAPANSVALAGWIFETYKYEPMETIISCLSNPPVQEYLEKTNQTTWRLTPEVITGWMRIVLNKESEKRELENQKQKEKERQVLSAPLYPEGATEDQKREIWASFYKEKFFDYQEARKDLEQKPKKWFEDPSYQEARNKYLASSKLQKELRDKREEIKKNDEKEGSKLK
jgi:hypothetical protein